MVFKVMASKVKVRNSIAAEPLKKYEPKLTHILATLGRGNDEIVKVTGSFNGQDQRNIHWRRHRLFTIEEHLVKHIIDSFFSCTPVLVALV